MVHSLARRPCRPTRPLLPAARARSTRGLALAAVLLASVLASVLTVAAPAAAHGQANPLEPAGARAACQAPPLPQVEMFPDYALRRRTRADLESMRACMRENRWGEALRIFFPESRREGFVNWVAYVDRDGRVFQSVTEGEGRRTEFRGEKYVWVLVFMDRPPRRVPVDGVEQPIAYVPVIAAGDSALIASRRSVNYQRDPLLGALFKFVVGKFLSSGDPGAPSVISDSTRTVELRRLAVDDDTMYVAQTRFGLAENTQVVLSVAPGRRYELPGTLRSAYANLGNSSVGRWEVGLTGGASFGGRSATLNADTLETGRAAGMRPNVYLTTYLNLVRPSLPWQRRSFGLVTGLNLVRGSLLDEVVAGLAIGRVLADAGIVAGASFVSETRAERDAPGERLRRVERRVPRLFVGVDFRL